MWVAGKKKFITKRPDAEKTQESRYHLTLYKLSDQWMSRYRAGVCGGFNEKCHPGLRHLNTQFPVRGTVWRGHREVQPCGRKCITVGGL